MSTFELYKNNVIANFFLEDTASKGIRRVTDTVRKDIALVTGMEPPIISELSGITGNIILAGMYGESKMIATLEENGHIDCRRLKGKRECYLMKIVESPFDDYPQIKKAMVIVGSDKRGTIYGLFHLSELCGVSPLVFWGDAAPQKRDEVMLTFDKAIESKEPSVRYRGFFINDEWPAFGKWCTEQFGGVNARAYEKIFELVLRLKGNYLWPAMWRSSFWEEGPELESARLADEYGVIMGTSHHEPLCRAGVEWQNQYQQYGDDNTWSFITNSDAITEFWRDGLKRSKGLENIITIGMRGEDDSLLMSEDTPLQDNIDVVKKAIHVQNQLIREEVSEQLEDVPRMLAIYKEVEDFYFGAEDCDGLREFDEIEDVILLLSDDNYSSLRSLPQKDDKPHKGGYGMYYHFDYHGAPYSYEWLGNTNLVKAWEQLTMAYEYGIREMWIVNVGDIKGNEYPLSFFMNLAYDYEHWGISNINSVHEFTKAWIEQQFAPASALQKETIHQILDDYTRLTTMRLPESLNETVYKSNYHEIMNVRSYIERVQHSTETLKKELPEELITPYESMIYYFVMASLNIISLNLAAAANHELGRRGVLAANDLIPSIAEKVALDETYTSRFHEILNGKWNHMMDSAHTGFRNWDDNDWTYPQALTVYPIPYGKIAVSFRGDTSYHLGYHWQDKEPLRNEEMMRPDVDTIYLNIDSRGSVDFQYKISCPEPWLSFSQPEGTSCLKKQSRTTIEITCDRDKLSGEQIGHVHIDFLYENGTKQWSDVEIAAGSDIRGDTGAFLETEGYLCIHAENFDKNVEIDGMGWQVIPRLGRTSHAIKSFPVTKNWQEEEKRPYVEYKFLARKSGNYNLTFYTSPRNPMIKRGTVRGAYSINEAGVKIVDAVEKGFFAEWQNETWSYGVTNNIRIIKETVTLQQGLNTLQFYSMDPNMILEKIVLNPVDRPIKETHLAPPESYRM